MKDLIKDSIIMQLQELQSDFEDLDDYDLISCREVILERINICLELMGETDEYNL